LVYTTGADHVPYDKLVIERPVAVRETLKGIFYCNCMESITAA